MVALVLFVIVGTTCSVWAGISTGIIRIDPCLCGHAPLLAVHAGPSLGGLVTCMKCKYTCCEAVKFSCSDGEVQLQ